MECPILHSQLNWIMVHIAVWMPILSLGTLFDEILMLQHCKFFHFFHKGQQNPTFKWTLTLSFDSHIVELQHDTTFCQNDHWFKQECKQKEFPKLTSYKLKPILVHIPLEDWMCLTTLRNSYTRLAEEILQFSDCSNWENSYSISSCVWFCYNPIFLRVI